MIYLLYGDEEYLKSQSIERLRKKFGEMILGINYIELDESNISEIIQDIETPSFGFEKKLIIAKKSGLFKNKNPFAKMLVEFLKSNDMDNCYLVFIENSVDQNELFKYLKSINSIYEFKELPINELIKRIKEYCKNSNNVEIKENVCQYLIQSIGTNLQDIMIELDKLTQYVGNEGEINKEAIDELCIKKSESIIFDLTDNLGKRNISKAIDVLHNLVSNKEPEQKILVMLYNHFKKLYIVKKSNRNEISTNLKLKSNQTFLINKYTIQSNYFTETKLEEILKKFREIDEKSKNGEINISIGLDSVLCNL